MKKLLFLVILFLFVGCNDEEIKEWNEWLADSSVQEQVYPDYRSCCYQNALFACAVIGDYFEDYEVVTTANHSECRVYVDEKMYYVKLCGSLETGYGVKLYEDVIADMSDIRFSDDLVSFSERVVIWQKTKRENGINLGFRR